jgi:hypothetical protein
MRLFFECPTLKQLSSRVEDLRQAHFVSTVSGREEKVRHVLDSIALMPESRVQELIRELRVEGRL